MWLTGADAGPWITTAGLALLAFMFVGWFGTVIRESEGRLYNEAVDRSFRMGMMWFIFSEVMFFAAFFGALWYARNFSVPWLGGEGDGMLTKGDDYPIHQVAEPIRQVLLERPAARDFYLRSLASRCRVGASTPRCRVVPSVTLATGGLNSSVRGAGSSA